MRLPDPTLTTAWDSLDLGSWYSPDGREHPITGMTPVVANAPETAAAAPPVAAASVSSDLWDKLIEKIFGKNLGLRAVIGLIGLLLLVVGVIRLSR